MELNDAVNILQNQAEIISKPIKLEYYNNWVSATLSFYKDIFGENSHEYSYMNINAMPDWTYYNEQEKNQALSKLQPIIAHKILVDIEVLKLKELQKKPIQIKEVKSKDNWFSHYDNAKMIGLIITIFLAGVGGTLGLQKMIKENSPATFTSPVGIEPINNKAEDKKDTQQNTKPYNKVPVDTSKSLSDSARKS